MLLNTRKRNVQTRVKFNLRLRANRPSNNPAMDCNQKGPGFEDHEIEVNLAIYIHYLHLKISNETGFGHR